MRYAVFAHEAPLMFCLRVLLKHIARPGFAPHPRKVAGATISLHFVYHVSSLRCIFFRAF